MKIFCRELWRILEPKVADNIFDQAVANWLVYNGRLPVENIFELGVDHGEIFTVGLALEQEQIKIRDGKIFRGDGGVPEVVHQYDRSDEMVRLVDELYRDKNFTVDPNFTDTRSLLEQVISLLHADKISEATRLFLKNFFATADFNAHVHALVKIWMLVLEKDFTPTVEVLELAVQKSLLSSQEIFYKDLLVAGVTLIRAQKRNHAVDPVLKNAVVNSFAKLVRCNTASGNFD